MSSTHYESLTASEQRNYFPKFVMDYAKYSGTTESGGLRDHWERYGFSHDTVQAIRRLRRLAEGPSGHHYQLRFGARYIYHLCMHPMHCPDYIDKDVDYPGGFVQVKVYDKPSYDTSSVPCYPKEGEDNLLQTNQLYNKFYTCVCAMRPSPRPSWALTATSSSSSIPTTSSSSMRDMHLGIVSATSERSCLWPTLAD